MDEVTEPSMKSDQDSMQAQAVPEELRLIRLREVQAICGKSRISSYEAIKNRAFPQPVQFGARSTAWVKSEVLQWVQSCVDASRPQYPPAPCGTGSSDKKQSQAFDHAEP
jgi:prophage regulatory protein